MAGHGKTDVSITLILTKLTPMFLRKGREEDSDPRLDISEQRAALLIDFSLV